MNDRATDNTADCPVKWDGSRTFTEWRLSSDFNNYTQHNISNNNDYRLFLQRNGETIIEQHRNQAYTTNQCNSCDLKPVTTLDTDISSIENQTYEEINFSK